MSLYYNPESCNPPTPLHRPIDELYSPGKALIRHAPEPKEPAKESAFEQRLREAVEGLPLYLPRPATKKQPPNKPAKARTSAGFFSELGI